MFRILLAALCICGALLFVPAAASATDTDTPVGTWLRADGPTVFAIAPCASGLCGSIVGFSLGAHDPEPLNWRGQPICGEVIIVVTQELGTRNKWHGTITNPKNGNMWQATLTLVNGTLQLRGYFGVPLFGETEDWTRYTDQIGAGCRILTVG